MKNKNKKFENIENELKMFQILKQTFIFKNVIKLLLKTILNIQIYLKMQIIK